MKCIDRIKPEVLEKIKEYKKEYHYLGSEIFEELEANEAWTRLPYCIAVDIENMAGQYIGDCFYTREEVEKLTKNHTIMNFNVKQLENGKIFNVTFRKKNGAIRKMNARLGVRKSLSGVGLKYDPKSRGNLIVYSMGDDGYRTIKLDSILRIKCNGVEYTVA